MKEYIINVLNSNCFVGENMWKGLQLLLLYSPLYIIAILLLIRKYIKEKKEYPLIDIIGIFNKPLYIVCVLLVFIYSFVLIFDIFAIGNSIILYEINN